MASTMSQGVLSPLSLTHTHQRLGKKPGFDSISEEQCCGGHLEFGELQAAGFKGPERRHTSGVLRNDTFFNWKNLQ